jgi:cell division protein FtsQ
MGLSLPRREPRAKAAPPKNRRVQQAKPRVQPQAQPHKPARASASANARPNRRVGGPRPAQSLKSPRAAPRRRLLGLLRALARPTLGPRARRFLSVSMRLGVAVVLAWGLLLGAQQGYQYVTTSAHFEARSVAFEPTPHLSADRLTELMGLPAGTNILAVDVDAMRSKIEADPWVASATVQRQLPDTLRVVVTEHEPVAVLLSGYFYLLNREGEPFKRVETGERGELPVITGVERDLLVKSDPAAAQIIRRALDVLAAYDERARPRLSEVHIGEGGEALLYTEKTGTLLRLGRGPLGDKLARFDALRAALGERADKLSVVHLDAEQSPDRPARVVASFIDQAEATELLAQAVPKPRDPAAGALQQMADKPTASPKPAPAHAPGKPAKHKGKAVKHGTTGTGKTGGAHKFPSGIPKYD